MKKSIINDGILINTEEIKKVVYFSELDSIIYKFENVDIDHIKYYQDKLDCLSHEKKEKISEDFSYFENYLGIEAVELEERPDYRSLVIWQEGEFFNLEDCNVSEIYEYRDTFENRRIIIEHREDFDIDDSDSVNLDKWDGSNFNSGRKGYHEYVYKVKDQDVYLLIKTSDYQGSLQKAELMDLDEIITYLEDNSENDGDFEEEIFLIKNL